MPIINGKNFTQLTNLNVTGDLYSKGSRSGAVGDENIAIGIEALQLENPAVIGNIAIGDKALQNFTDGFGHVAVGWNALQFMETGNWNVAVGEEALWQCVDGSRNTAIGTQSQLLTTSGSRNVCLGAFSGQWITTGDENIVIGYSAGEDLDTESRCIVIGNFPTTVTGDDQLNIGDLITGDLAAQHLSLNLPTSDPSISGVLWNDAGTVKVSA